MRTSTSFRANAHLLKLLGNELIGDDRLAVFELVKNAYDADAKKVDVQLNLSIPIPNIVVWDHEGIGMSKDDFINKWMEIGTESKRNKNRNRTPILHRMPLGEKGVGRLAVHKLGSKLQINTKANNSKELSIEIDWTQVLGSSNYIEDVSVEIEELDNPFFFKNNETGTRIEISELNNKNWTRGDIRRLKRMLTSLISPFKSVSDFDVNFLAPGREKDLEGVPNIKDILDIALWRYDFMIDEHGNYTYNYIFNPPSLFKEIASSRKNEDNIQLELIQPTREEENSRNPEIKDSLLLKKEDIKEIGPISGSLYIYLQHQAILNALGSAATIKTYLREQSGIRIYRDGIRVFNYGEPNDDWLGLNTGRINSPGKKIDTSMVIGAIDLELEQSNGLQEKTNREGFDDNNYYKIFKWVISSVIEHFHILHRNDRDLISQYLKGDIKDSSPATTRFVDNISEIRKSIKKHGLETELSGKVDQIENDFHQMREVTLSTGIAGINLAVIFHEVERGIDDLNYAIRNSDDYQNLLKRAEHLSELLEGFAPLLRRNEQKVFQIRALVQKIMNLSQHRFNFHKIITSSPILIDDNENFTIKAPFGLLQAALTNLVDNSIHWTKLKREKEGDKYTPAIRILGLPKFFAEGPALVVVDNGPGFSISPEEAIQPFKTTRPGGMGVGLYYADKVMETIGGKLLICNADELDLPESYNGAAVVMIFSNGIK